jgi:hypothetical protein
MKKTNLMNRIASPLSNLVILLFVCLLGAQTTEAQVASTYSFAASTGNTLNPMTGSTTLVAASNDDGNGGVQSIGFNFVYEGVTYTQYSSSVNGLVRFGPTVVTGEFTNTIISGTNVPKLMPCWDDHHTGTVAGGGKVHTVLVGTSPNQIRIIEWFVTIPRSTAGAANSRFQCWIYEGTNVIEYRYGTSGGNTNSATYGLGGATAANYLALTTSTGSATTSTTVPNNVNLTWPGNGTKYTFAPPVPCVPPANQVTNLTLTSISTSQINGSFTAPVVAPSGYLVVRYPAGTAVTAPANGTTYAVGATLGTLPNVGTVIANGISTSFNSTGLSANTTYDYYVYAYTAGLCTGTPVYNTTLIPSANTGSQTTNSWTNWHLPDFNRCISSLKHNRLFFTINN